MQPVNLFHATHEISRLETLVILVGSYLVFRLVGGGGSPRHLVTSEAKYSYLFNRRDFSLPWEYSNRRKFL
jgi:hypothetical protein